VVHPETRVNEPSYDTLSVEEQFSPNIVRHRDGRSVAVWYDYRESGQGWGVYAQRLGTDGRPLGDNIKVSPDSLPFYENSVPVAGMDSAGNFIVAWLGDGLFAQRFDWSGTPVGGPIKFNSDRNYPDLNPSLAMNPDGRFVAGWYGYDDTLDGHFARWFDSGGNPLGPEVQLDGIASQASDIPAQEWNTASWDPSPIGFPRRGYTFIPADSSSDHFYSIDTIPLGMTPLSGGAELTSLKGSEFGSKYERIKLPFPFKLYGGAFDSVAVFSNGVLGFGPGDPYLRYLGGAQNTLVRRAPPHDIIAPSWSSIYVPAEGAVTVDSSGAPPHRVMTVEWRGMRQSGGVSGGVSFQVDLHEDSNMVVMRYSDTEDSLDFSYASYALGLKGPASSPNLWPVPTSPAVAMDDGGRAVIALMEYVNDEPKVCSQWYNSSGNPTGALVKATDSLHYPDPEAGVWVASDSAGDAVALWYGTSDLYSDGVYAQRIDPSGSIAGEAIFVSGEESYAEWYRPSALMTPDGGMTVFYIGELTEFGLIARRFDRLGNPLPPIVMCDTISYPLSFDYAPDPLWTPTGAGIDRNGNITVVWNASVWSSDIIARSLAANGGETMAPYVINDDREIVSGVAQAPHVASDRSGNLVVVWQEERHGTPGLYYQRFDSNGSKLGANVRVNGTGDGLVGAVDVAMNEQGEFIIAWTPYFDTRVIAQRFTTDGTPNGAMIIIDSTATNYDYAPRVVLGNYGGFTISWMTRPRSYVNQSIALRYYDATGAARGSAFTVSGDKPPEGSSYSMTMSPDGTVLVVWTAYVDTWPGRHMAVVGWVNRFSDPFVISQWASTADKISPAAANIGYNAGTQASEFLVSWLDRRNYGAGIEWDAFSKRLTTEGYSGVQFPNFLDTKVNDNPIVYPSDGLLIGGFGDGGGIVGWQTYDAHWNLRGQRIGEFDSLFFGNFALADPVADYAGDPDLTAGPNRIAAVWIQSTSLLSGSDVMLKLLKPTDPAEARYFTLGQDSLMGKSVSLKAKRFRGEYLKRVQLPSPGNIRDSVYARAFTPYGGLVIGVPRSDSAKVYGWTRWKKGADARKAFPHTGAPRGFDGLVSSTGPRPFVKEQRGLKPLKHNNHLLGEQHALKINIAASDLGITPPGFGDLVYADSTDTTSAVYRRSFRSISKHVDSVLTFWKTVPALEYTVLDSCLTRANRAFSGKLDTFSTRPLRIRGTRFLADVWYLRPNPSAVAPPGFQMEASEPSYAEHYGLDQNYPNPFNPSTTVSFALTYPSEVTLKVFNVLGQVVAVLYDREQIDEGSYEAVFDGAALASGVYLCRLEVSEVQKEEGVEVETSVFVKKMILLK
jgi:hypothetical protein